MNYQKFKELVNFSAICLILTSCEKYTMPEANPVVAYSETVKDAAYYEALRAYKKSDHQIYFGWLGASGEAGSPEAVHIIETVPDSVDIISLWGGVPPKGSHGYQVMQETRKQKGTRFVDVFFPNRFDSFDFPRNEEGVKMFADTLIKYNEHHELDGIDIDYEAHVLSIFSNDDYMQLLIEELAKKMGPKSGTEKLLIIDSFVETLPAGVVPYLDYYVVQAYSPQGGSVASLPRRFGQAPGMPFEKCIAAENFEARWQSGGLLLDYAKWNPQQGRKGGVATYHTGYEYALTPDYKYTRQAIQIMNPAVR